MRKATIVFAACACLLARASELPGSQALVLDVSPSIMQAPGFVIVRAHIESSDDNRLLQIATESPDFSRASAIQLDGRHAPRLSVFEYSNLPPGTYDVTAVLMGPNGRRAAATRFLKVMPSLGR